MVYRVYDSFALDFMLECLESLYCNGNQGYLIREKLQVLNGVKGCSISSSSMVHS